MQHTLPESERAIPTEMYHERHEEAIAFMFHVGVGSVGRPIAITNGLVGYYPTNAQRGDLVSVT
jgi:hypothetical protein